MECDRNLCYTALQNNLSCAECEAMRSGEYYDDYDMTDSYISGCEDGFYRAVERMLASVTQQQKEIIDVCKNRNMDKWERGWFEAFEWMEKWLETVKEGRKE